MLAEAEGDTDFDADELGETEADGLVLADGLLEADSLDEGESDAEGETDALGEIEAEALALGETDADGDSDADGDTGIGLPHNDIGALNRRRVVSDGRNDCPVLRNCRLEFLLRVQDLPLGIVFRRHCYPRRAEVLTIL